MVLNLLHRHGWFFACRCSHSSQRAHDVFWIVVLLVVLPHLFGPDAESTSDWCFVVVDTILNSVGLTGVVQNQALVILRAGIHHLTKHFKCWKNAKKRLVQALAILDDVLTKHKHVIHIRAQVWTQVHTVLHRQQKEDFPVATIHKALTDTRVFHERFVVHTVVQKQKGARFVSLADQASLALKHLFNSWPVVIPVDEQVGNKLAVVVISILCTGHDNSTRNVFLVVHNVRHESTFACSALSDEYTHLVVPDGTGIKPLQLQICHSTKEWLFFECFIFATSTRMDQWFTGTPQRTYFETKSEPRINRSRESFELPFDNQPTYGQTGRCTVPPKGDFLTGLTLRTVLPPIYPTVPGQYVYPKPSSEVGANVYVNLGLTFAIADGVTLTANTNGNHYFSVGAQVTLTGAKTYTGSGFLIYDLDGTYTVASIPTANSFTCAATVAGTCTTGTVSTVGIACADIVSYFSTQNSNLWVDNLTNKTWQITGGSNVGTSWTFTTSAPSNFPVGSSITLNLPSSGVLNQVFSVTASSDTTFTITKSNSIFIALYQNQILSVDGITWNTVTSPLLSSSRLAYGNGVWVAVHFSGSQYRSTDNGITWTAVASPLAGSWYAVAYGNGVFVMVGAYTNWQARSTDYGLTWTAVAVPLTLTAATGPIAYGSSVFVSVSQNSQMRSTNDGVSWTAVATPLIGDWNDVAYGNGIFVMVANSVTKIARSTNLGVTWTAVTSPSASGLRGIAYGNSVFVAVGQNVQIRSTDYGVTWNTISSPLSGDWFKVVYGNGVFVMVGQDNILAYSSDLGQTWSYSSSPIYDTWDTVQYGNFTYTNSASDSVSLVTPPLQLTNRVFSSSVYSSINFANATDAAFWGFDARQGLTYTLTATPPWTLTQSGWITGFLPPSLSTYVDSVAHKLVKSGRILIGKQTIKEFTGEYIELQNDLWVPYENKAILKLLNGTLDQTQSVAAREYYVRVPLGTHEYPLCALTQQHLSVQFDFDQYSALSDNLNQGSGQFTDSKSFTEYDGLSLNVQTTFSYQQYIFVVATDGRLIVYDTTKSFTDPASYQIITALAGSTSLFSQFCVLSGVLYIGLTNGQLIRGNLSELIQGNTSSFVLNNYTPTNGSLTGTLVADFRYVYYSVSNTVNSNVFMTKYDTTSGFQTPVSYKWVDFTKTFNSSVTGVYQTLSDGKQLILLPQGSPGKLYTFQLNANVQSQWYLLDYSVYGYQVTEGVIIGNTLYFVCDNFSILTYSNSTFNVFNFNLDFVSASTYSFAKSFNYGKTWSGSSFAFYGSLAFGGNDIFVVVGNGTQGRSTDLGLTWTAVASPLAGIWSDVAYGNGVFVMVASGTQARSTDFGKTWQTVASPLAGNWSSVTYGNGIFVMVGYGTQARSTDLGVTWTAVASPLAGNWNRVAYGNGVFVAVGSSPYQARSTNFGQSWQAAATPVAGYGSWFGVTYGNGFFVAVGAGYQAYSNDLGITWYSATSLGNYWFSVAYKNGVFVMTGYGQAYSTDNGHTWNLTSHQYSSSGYWYSVIPSESSFTIAGDGLRNLRAFGNYIYASTNQVAVQIDTTKDMSSSSAYQIAPLTSGQYIFANGPRYIYLFNQGSSGSIQRFDPYSPDTTFRASIIADYESLPTGVPKPDKAILSIIQSQHVTNMSDLKLQGPIRELWFTGEPGSNVYEYSNLSSQSSLTFNGEDIVTPDVGTQKFLSVIEPFETHTTMPVRNISVVAFEQDPESDIPNGTVNFSRIREQVFDGGATSAWARSINVLKIQGGLGGLVFNS